MGLCISTLGSRATTRVQSDNSSECNMPVPHQILIYAELLSNIRQVSVGCSLHTPSSSSTKAGISSDGLELTISHDGVESSVRLPGQVASPQQLPIQSKATKSLSWRLSLAASSRPLALTVSDAQTVPWSASSLQPESAIRCRKCQNVIVNAGCVKVWKDLPSENWAEMMEFWHCHKPHDHKHGDDEGLASRGYGANARILAQPGVGFVDLTSFLLSETDVSNAAITNSPSPSTLSNGVAAPHEKYNKDNTSSPEADSLVAFCGSCKSHLGVLNSQTSSISLFKWQVSVNETIQRGPSTPPNLCHYVSAMLLATMARSGCSKSIVMPMKSQIEPAQNGSSPTHNGTSQSLLNIWVFNANIVFSSTGERRSPIPAIKVLYRMVSPDEADKMLESMTSDMQDITLPADAIEIVLGILSRSNGFVPQHDRKFREWTVGLLEKWDDGGG
ncbi:ubiquitin-conjugating enzyme E2-binding protein [Whalleya microplaca]|nr:ubiquitin-conjugating enzyme E2-binding protein [Whalleya microplaca]